MNRAIKYGTGIVLAHLLVNVIHGVAHRELHVGLEHTAMLFVIGVILVCPLVAMALLWASQKWLGLVLLAVSMAASLMFGLYNHFVRLGPDQVGKQIPGPWGTAFVITAYLLLLTEAVGTLIAVYFLCTGQTSAAE